MRKELVEFKAEGGELELATLELSAVCLSPQEHGEVMKELGAIEGICITFIDADSIMGKMSGAYEVVYDTTGKLMKKGWSFTDELSGVNV